MMIDAHCHLTSPDLLPQVDAVVARAREAGVAAMVTIATDLADAARALDLSTQYEQVHVVAGIHPHEAGKVEVGWESALRDVVTRGDVFAVGEMGLDYHYDFADRPTQAAVFRRQLEIARDVDKPVVIHCRDAHDDAMKILAEFPGPAGVVFHCFTGTGDEADAIWRAGYWLSLTGVVTFKRSDVLRAVAARMPDDRFMIETDSPYLAPEPRRGRRNEPAYVAHVADRLAAIKGLSRAALEEATSANFFRLFDKATRPAGGRCG